MRVCTRAYLLSRQTQAFQQPPKRPGMQGLAKASLAEVGEALGRVGRDEPARLENRPREHDLDDLGLLLGCERRRTAAVPTIGEPVDPVRIVAQHPVPQCLGIHARRTRGLLTARPIQRIRDCEDAANSVTSMIGRIAVGSLGRARRPSLAVLVQRSRVPRPGWCEFSTLTGASPCRCDMSWPGSERSSWVESRARRSLAKLLCARCPCGGHGRETQRLL